MSKGAAEMSHGIEAGEGGRQWDGSEESKELVGLEAGVEGRGHTHSPDFPQASVPS